MSLDNFEAFRDADKKFRQGDSLSDAELALLRKRYRAAAKALRDAYNPTYALVAIDLNNRADTLDGYHVARMASRERKRAKSVEPL